MDRRRRRRVKPGPRPHPVGVSPGYPGVLRAGKLREPGSRIDDPPVDLLERARALAACPLFETLAPAVVIRLAERARATTLARGERRTTDDTVWIVASGSLAVVVREASTTDITASIARKRGAPAITGNALGMVRVVRPATPVVDLIAEVPTVVVGVGFDDVRDVLEEDANALTALADRLAGLLLSEPS